MNRPELYEKPNQLTRLNTELAFERFGHVIRCRPDGKDTLLDFGCAPGDVLNDIVIPWMCFVSLSKVIGVDISSKNCSKLETGLFRGGPISAIERAAHSWVLWHCFTLCIGSTLMLLISWNVLWTSYNWSNYWRDFYGL